MIRNAPKLAPITISREALRSFDESSRLEWLETNGAGGYAMGPSKPFASGSGAGSSCGFAPHRFVRNNLCSDTGWRWNRMEPK